MIIRLNIICPFCLDQLNGAKTFLVVKTSYPIRVYYPVPHDEIRITEELSNEWKAEKFETEILQKHLTKCSMADKLSDSVLQHYQLKK